MYISSRKGFTLIELLVVLAIIAILAVVVVLTLNPAELLRQARDSNRVSDMSTLTSALGEYNTDQSGASSFNMGSPNVVYVSIPDPTATSTAGDQCQGLGLISLPSTYTYHCSETSTYRNVNGTGWIPINFQNMSTGSPLGSLPVDPTNTSSTRLYYTYTTNGTQYEVTAVMESAKYQLGGSNDVISGDGGPLASVYEKGSKLGLEPLDYGDATLVGYWPFNEGAGTVAYDDSGNGNNGTLTSGPTWVSGKVQSNALSFGSSAYVAPGAIPNLGTGDHPNSVSMWIYLTAYPTSNLAAFSYSAESGCAHGHIMLYIYIPGYWGYATCANDFASSLYIPLNQWVFIAASYSGSKQVMVVMNSQSQLGTLSSPLNLGSFSSASLPVPGSGITTIENDVRVWNRALSAAQLTAMYSGGK